MSETKPEVIEINGVPWRRIPVKTHVITDRDDIAEVIDRYTRKIRERDDWVTISESVVAITQGRAIPESSIRIGPLAKILWRCVTKSPYGIGLRSPATMQCAIDQCGAPRILLAAAVGAVSKLIGRKGDFYRVAGVQAATIDAAGTSPLQPDRVLLGPENPDAVAERILDLTNLDAAVMDVNDIGGSWVIGRTGGIDPPLLEDIMRDNPAGQSLEQTPVILIRRIIEPIQPERKNLHSWFYDFCNGADEAQTGAPEDTVFHSCPYCGFPTLGERGKQQLCCMCDWIDTGYHDIHQHTVQGGPNGDYSLTEARANFANDRTMFRPHDQRLLGINERHYDLKVEIKAILKEYQFKKTARLSRDEIKAVGQLVNELES